MRALVLTIAAGTLVAAGCTTIPEYQRPAAPVSNVFPVDGVYATGAVRGPGDRDASAHAAGDIGWREFFVDPRLQSLVEIALRNSRNLRVAILNV